MSVRSRSTVSSLLGLRWDRWFSGATREERAEETNRRLKRCHPAEKVKLRSTTVVPEETTADGTLTAIVSPSYTPISDVAIGRLLHSGLRGTSGDHRILRQFSTDKTTSYLVGVGEPQHVGGIVGEVWGALHVINSGVGYSSLSISAHLMRLVCSNGMKAPIPMAEIARRRHRGIQLEALGTDIFEGLRQLPAGLQRSMTVLDAATGIVVDDVEHEVAEILKGAHIAVKKHAVGIMAAYRQEPIASAFGISQAVTYYAAHSEEVEPELAAELERAAGDQPFTSVLGDGELLFEGAEFVSWKRPIVDIANCTCLCIGCVRPWLVQLRRANECMVVMPAFDELDVDPIAGPPEFADRCGILLLPPDKLAALREIVPDLPPLPDLAPLSVGECARIIIWEMRRAFERWFVATPFPGEVGEYSQKLVDVFGDLFQQAWNDPRPAELIDLEGSTVFGPRPSRWPLLAVQRGRAHLVLVPSFALREPSVELLGALLQTQGVEA